ncbi:hypothetical protein BDY21DRAFT_363466 [Lineolata rhizophorae]|uniref:Uncharacterized protein n=1 Tax=Lineolata rhizophorae TaxID=578093 RepID=A0A6A6P1N3_9PEZI|nr:hypothetical protein BDY21DRAFT_363466 [Lineolata rhizophorae]
MSPSGTLSLFPPPEEMPPRRIPSPKPYGIKTPSPPPAAPSALPSNKPASPEPSTGKAAGQQEQQAPANFHELVIRVTPTPEPEPQALRINTNVRAPEKAHLSNNPPQQIWPWPPRSDSMSPVAGPQKRKTPSPTPPTSHVQLDPNNIPPPPSAANVAKRRVASPEPPRHVISPAPQSGSPTLARSNSAATRVPGSPSTPGDDASPAPMRSMFPTYNPHVPLAQQAYRPAAPVVAPIRISREQISRPQYSPTFYTPYQHLGLGGQAAAAAAERPRTAYFTPAAELGFLWDAANGEATPAAARGFSLQMHRAVELPPATKKAPRSVQIALGPSPERPLYSVTQPLPPAGASTAAAFLDERGDEAELVIRRHHPGAPQQQALPVAHLLLSAPPPPPTTAACAPPSMLVCTVYPKLSALAALELAAQSPVASSIAQFDPTASSPAAQRLAEQAVAEDAAREACQLVWTRDEPAAAGGSPAPPSSSSSSSSSSAPVGRGSYTLHHPTLGPFPFVLTGAVSRGAALATRVSASASAPSPSPPSSATPPPTITLLNPFVAVGSPSSGSSSAGGDALASLDLAAGALALDLAALTRLGASRHLVDVVASAVVAVAVAEGRRCCCGGGDVAAGASPGVGVGAAPGAGLGVMFAGPPGREAVERSRREGEKERRRREKREGKARKAAAKRAAKGKGKGKHLGVDIELGQWDYGGGADGADDDEEGARGKRRGDDDDMPRLTRTILSLLGLGLKTVVVLLTFGVKVVAKIILGVSRWVTTKA